MKLKPIPADQFLKFKNIAMRKIMTLLLIYYKGSGTVRELKSNGSSGIKKVSG